MRARIADIIHHASQLSGVSADKFIGKGGVRYLVRIRHAVMLIAREQTRRDADGKPIQAYSFPQIARSLGMRDHSTIIHGVAKAKDTVARDPEYAAFVAALRNAATTGLCEPFNGPILTKHKLTRTRTNVKAVNLRAGELPDAGHLFHAAIGRGSDKLAAALLKALAA